MVGPIRREQYDTTGTDAETVSQAAADAEVALWCAAPDEALSVVRLQSGMTFGRDESCTVKLNTESASRRHASIHFRGALWWCDDAESRNGTYLNGRRVRTAPIGPGDVLRLGEWLWVVAEVPARVPPRRFEELAPGLFGGESLQRALEPARRAAGSTLPIIVEGETGSGKERVARAIHDWSKRSGDFVAVNCAALVGSLAEAELFGYRKGAFTGAERAHEGVIRAANHGTLLLDEICELPWTVQAKLLRVLEERTVVPVGETRPLPIDVRVVSAAQEPLEAMVAAKRFRADLLARLKGLVVGLTPLRDRREDVAGLLRLFLSQLRGGDLPRLHPRFMEAVLVHGHPDNVRGLWQLARQLVCVYGHEPELRRSHLPAEFLPQSITGELHASSAVPVESGGSAPHASRPAAQRAATEDDWPALLEALKASKGNVAQAAALVGLSRHQAYRLMKGKGFSELDDLRREHAASEFRST